MLNKIIFILPLAFLLVVGCATTPTISTLPFQESRSETIEKSGLSISTDRIAQKIKVKSPDLEIILPLADDWSLLSSPKELLRGNSVNLKMEIRVDPAAIAGTFEGSAEEYLSKYILDFLKSWRAAYKNIYPISDERVIEQGDIKIYTYEIGYPFFHFARKAASGRILHLTVLVMTQANRRDSATVEKYVAKIIAPSFVALK